MKIIFFTLIFSSIAILSQAQTVGAGLGTAGINIKADFEQLKLIGRVNPVFSSRFENTLTVNGYLMAGKKIINEDNADLYLGLGAGSAGTDFSQIMNETKWYIFAPVGVDLLPFSSGRIALTAEVGPRFDYIDGDPPYFVDAYEKVSIAALFEFTCYF